MALSPELKDATNHIASHAQGLRAVLTIVDEIERIGGLEQLAAEAESRRDAALNEAGELDRQIAGLRRAADEATAKLDGVNNQAAAIIADAEAKAGEIVAGGTVEAEAILEEGRKRLGEIDAEVAARRASLATIDKEIDDAQGKVKALEDEAADVLRRAEEARNYLKTLAGG